MTWIGKFPYIAQPEAEESAFARDFQLTSNDFAGPLLAFLELLDNESTKLSELPLFPMIDRYKNQLAEKKWNLSVQSGFLLLASALTEMKSRLLLPTEKVEEDELVPDDRIRHEHLYEQYRQRAQELLERKKEFERIYLRPEVLPMDAFPAGPVHLAEEVGINQLVSAFQKLLQEVELRENPTEIQALEATVTVAEKVELIEKMIQEHRDGVSLRSLLRHITRLEIIVTFVAILELAKSRRILVKQLENFGEIWIVGNTITAL